MQETAKVSYIQQGKGFKKGKAKSSEKGSKSGSGSSGKPYRSSGKGRKVPLPIDICWRCGKGRHQKGQHKDRLTGCRRLPRSTISSKEKDSRKVKQNPVKKAQQVVGSSSGKPYRSSGKGRKVPLPIDICWRCGEGGHQKRQSRKAVEAVGRNCSIKGHYEKVCMKGKSIHLVNVPNTSTNSASSESDYFNEHGDPVYAHMVNIKESNWKKI